MTRKEIEDRLVGFASLIFNLSKKAETKYFGSYLINQLLCSSASAALNYRESQSAEVGARYVVIKGGEFLIYGRL